MNSLSEEQTPENISSEDKPIPSEINEALIAAILYPLDQKSELIARVNSLLEEPQWKDLLKEGYFDLDETFFDQLKLKLENSYSELFAFFGSGCNCWIQQPNGRWKFFSTCPPCKPR